MCDMLIVNFLKLLISYLLHNFYLITDLNICIALNFTAGSAKLQSKAFHLLIFI